MEEYWKNEGARLAWLMEEFWKNFGRMKVPGWQLSKSHIRALAEYFKVNAGVFL